MAWSSVGLATMALLGCTPDLNSLVGGAGSGGQADDSGTSDHADATDPTAGGGGTASGAGGSNSASDAQSDAATGTGGTNGVRDAMGSAGSRASEAGDGGNGADTRLDAEASAPIDGNEASDAPNDNRLADAPTPPEARAPREAGCPGPGYAFNSGQTAYFRMPRPVQDDFTLEAWIKLASSLTGMWFWQGSRVFWADVPTAGANDFSATVLSGKLMFTTAELGTSGVGNVVTNDWVHIAIARQKSGGQVQLFVNGVLDATGSAGSNVLDAGALLQIAGSDETHQGIDGLIDEVRIWSVARTAQQIASTMGHPLSGDEPGLVGYYRLDENGGTQAYDSSLAGNHGAFIGAPAWVPSDAPVCVSSVVRDASSDSAAGDR